jgi:LPXTG-site transpeptidase (sortase) family protein
MARNFRAAYDAEGNIVLFPTAPTPWKPEGEPQPKQAIAPEEKSAQDLKIVQERLRALLKLTLEEGFWQYRTSLVSSRELLYGILRSSTNAMRGIWTFLAQPVWIPGKHRIKHMSRGTLFLLDTVRFGGTFAGIFLLLFVTLNFQSFFEIFQANLDPVKIGRNLLEASLDTTLSDKLKRVPGLTEAGTPGVLLSFLPEVGPPENRLIIPKLNLNVPIVIPSYTSLLKEDWTQFEEDIQEALQFGVVHYPGTARPGQAGNFFITGHSSYYPWAYGKHKTVFARLPQLQIGDEFWVYYGGDKHRYVIRKKEEVKPSDISVLDQPVDERVSTLMTCTPIGTTLRRLILVAQEVDPETGIALAVGERTRVTAENLPKPTVMELPI